MDEIYKFLNSLIKNDEIEFDYKSIPIETLNNLYSILKDAPRIKLPLGYTSKNHSALQILCYDQYIEELDEEKQEVIKNIILLIKQRDVAQLYHRNSNDDGILEVLISHTLQLAILRDNPFPRATLEKARDKLIASVTNPNLEIRATANEV